MNGCKRSGKSERVGVEWLGGRSLDGRSNEKEETLSLGRQTFEKSPPEEQERIHKYPCIKVLVNDPDPATEGSKRKIKGTTYVKIMGY